MEGVELIGVVDGDLDRGAAHATPVGAKAYADLAELPEVRPGP
jgi:hypothetical protein